VEDATRELGGGGSGVAESVTRTKWLGAEMIKVMLALVLGRTEAGCRWLVGCPAIGVGARLVWGVDTSRWVREGVTATEVGIRDR
jgi:hypothetical protein